MKKYAVIVAGGSGLRMGSSLPKQFLLLHGKPILQYTINTFLKSYADLHIILVLPAEFLQSFESGERITVIAGGPTRFHSVKNGLQAITDEQAIVFVHDGVRCLLSATLIESCYNAALKNGNAIPAIKAVDSLRMETDKGISIIDRDKVWVVQTPQTFVSTQLRQAFQQEYDASFTDEASVVEKAGFSIHLVEGETDNIKITRPVDLAIAEKILSDRKDIGP